MIFWKDFVLSDFGPLLYLEEELSFYEGKRSHSGVTEDAVRDTVSKIQETGQGQQPARMVGYSSSAYHTQISMEAEELIEPPIVESGRCG